MSKVFVVNNSGHDLSSAEQFGKLIIMSEGSINKFLVSKMYREFEKYLKNSSPDDFILQSGPSIMCVVASSMFAAIHGRLNMLIWRIDGPGNESYVVRRLSFERMKESKQ